MDSSDSYDEEELHDTLYLEIRTSLNIDSDTLDDAWQSYRRICVNFNLEGDKMDWLACALYVACRRCVTPTGRGQAKIEGNMISLTRILRSCNISLVKFFRKIKNWIEMAKLPMEMEKKIEQIEKNFNVTSVIFKKYKPIFEDIFRCPVPPSRFNPKNRKIRKQQPLNSIDVFTFCWTLFVFFKSRYSKIGDDLVNSYHLLLVCLDYCFSSVLSFDNYRDIVNTNFYDMLTKKLGTDLRSLNNDNRVSIIDTLCEKWNGIPLEVNHIRSFWFKSLLENLIKNNHLRKKANGIIDNDVIDFNYKYIKKEYEEFVLTIGDFDECIFLNEAASEELGTSELATVDIDKKLQQQQMFANENNNLVPSTPLSSKQYLASRTPVKKVYTPISSATTSISRLHSILMNRTNEPSKDLEKIFDKCEANPKAKIQDIIEKMGEIFYSAYAKYNQEQSVIRSTDEFQCILTSGDEFATKRRKLAETFFYYILEKILKSELSKRIPEAQITQLLSKIVSNDLLIRSLYACSLEIILFSYDLCKNIFPWILEIYENHSQFKIPAFYFYKVIEPIIREEPGLSRDIVKHLNTIEEKILDSLAWTNDSPLWTLLAKSPPPTCAEVSLNVFNTETRENGAPFMMSPMPIKSEFNHPTTLVTIFPKGDVKRKLFNDVADGDKKQNSAGQSQDVSAVNEDKAIKEETEDNVSAPCTPIKVQKNSQINLFFRKVYSIASLRLRDLFRRLKITSDDIQLKIWTCFEYALQSHTYLMCDHHLDQMIMCSIYGVARIMINGERSIRFEDIIREYRLQPQACNLVYRNVSLKVIKQQVTTDSQSSAEINNVSGGPENAHGTIIDFYNKIFIPSLTQDYILKFSPIDKNSNIKLSPMPRNKFQSPNINSPLRVPNYPVFVSPLRSNYTSPNKLFNVRFHNNLNTSADLENINNMMKSSSNNMNSVHHNSLAARDMKASLATAMVSMTNLNAKRVSKRILQDDSENDNGNSPNKSFCSINRRIREIVSERQSMSAQSSQAPSTNVSDESNDSLQSNLSQLRTPNNNDNNHENHNDSNTNAMVNTTNTNTTNGVAGNEMNNHHLHINDQDHNHHHHHHPNEIISDHVVDVQPEPVPPPPPPPPPASQAVSVIQSNGEIGAFV